MVSLPVKSNVSGSGVGKYFLSLQSLGLLAVLGKTVGMQRWFGK